MSIDYYHVLSADQHVPAMAKDMYGQDQLVCKATGNPWPCSVATLLALVEAS